jgi:peptidoglycan/LPS O-acetylase OafA/YrhL
MSLFWLQSITLIGFAWDGPLWTVSAFAVCYLIFPFALGRSRDLSPSQLCWRLGWCTLASWATYGVVGIALQQIEIIRLLAIFRIPHFLTGMYAGLLAKRSPPSRPTLTAEICSVLLLGNLVVCAVVGSGNGGAWLFHARLAEFLLPPLHALWLAALAHPDCTGPTRAFLSRPPRRALGRISYSLYCLHFPLISWCCWALAGQGVSRAAVPSLYLNGNSFYFFLPAWAAGPVLAVCAAAAAAAYYLVEEPARRRMTGRCAGQQPTGPAQCKAGDADAAGPAGTGTAASRHPGGGGGGGGGGCGGGGGGGFSGEGGGGDGGGSWG